MSIELSLTCNFFTLGRPALLQGAFLNQSPSRTAFFGLLHHLSVFLLIKGKSRKHY